MSMAICRKPSRRGRRLARTQPRPGTSARKLAPSCVSPTSPVLRSGSHLHTRLLAVGEVPASDASAAEAQERAGVLRRTLSLQGPGIVSATGSERGGGVAKAVILAVDDDPAVSQAISRDLRRQYGSEYQVVRAASGADALTVLTEFALRERPVALIVSDQRMPVMTGVEFLEQARDARARRQARLVDCVRRH